MNTDTMPTYHLIRALDERQFAVLASTGERLGIYPSQAIAQAIVDNADKLSLRDWIKNHKRTARRNVGGEA